METGSKKIFKNGVAEASEVGEQRKLGIPGDGEKGTSALGYRSGGLGSREGWHSAELRKGPWDLS